MLGRLRGSGPARRLAGLWSALVDTFLRDNKVIPAVLALLTLFVFAWVVAGIFLDTPEEPVSNQTNFAQQGGAGGSEPPAPDIENRDVESYAAYQSKDPFRQLLAARPSSARAYLAEARLRAKRGRTGRPSQRLGYRHRRR